MGWDRGLGGKGGTQFRPFPQISSSSSSSSSYSFILFMGSDSLRILVSACLAGQNVRYNGAHKYVPVLLRGLETSSTSGSDIAEFFGDFPLLGRKPELLFICPETGCGFGVPREPIQLEGNPEDPKVMTVTSRHDVTQRLFMFTQARILEFGMNPPDAAVMKKGSPSCGVRGTPVFPGPGKSGVLLGTGLFALTFSRAFPFMPMAQENELESGAALDIFLLRAAIAREWRLFAVRDSEERTAFFQSRERALVRAFGTLAQVFIHNLPRMSLKESTSFFLRLLYLPLCG